MSNTDSDRAVGAVKAQRRGRLLLLVSGVVFVLYLANVLVGKASTLAGATSPVSIGDVPEFLLLFLASASFAVAVIQLEIAAERGPNGGR